MISISDGDIKVIARDLVRYSSRGDCPDSTKNGMRDLSKELLNQVSLPGNLRNTTALAEKIDAAQIYLNAARFIESEEASFKAAVRDGFRKKMPDLRREAARSAAIRMLWALGLLAVFLALNWLSRS